MYRSLTCPSIDDVKRIRPPPAALMPGSKARVTYAVPRVLTRSRRSKSAIFVLSNSLAIANPAQFAKNWRKNKI